MKRRKKIRPTIFDSNPSDETSRFSMIAEFEGNEENLLKIEVNKVLPVLPLRNMVLFPTAILPVAVGRESSLELIEEAERTKGYFAVVCQKDPKIEAPTINDIYEIGTVGKIIKLIKFPDGNATALLQGFRRVKIKRITRKEPYMRGSVEPIVETIPDDKNDEYRIIVDKCLSTAVRILELGECLEHNLDTNCIHSFIVELLCFFVLTQSLSKVLAGRVEHFILFKFANRILA
jgi:ATP-dependent Lon protease